uniref:Uncharacterized protein n=1 Tax=Gorilla gorilla gorilla TaxID=9595 RepID=A0A2I2YJ73_GORGO
MNLESWIAEQTSAVTSREKEKKTVEWKVSQPKPFPRGSRSLFYSLGLACAFSGVEKYISYKEFNRQKGAQRNLKCGLGGEAVGGRRAGAGGTPFSKLSRRK